MTVQCIRLRPVTIAGIKERAFAAGQYPSEWVRALVERELAKKPPKQGVDTRDTRGVMSLA